SGAASECQQRQLPSRGMPKRAYNNSGRNSTMAAHADQPKGPGSKADSKPDAKDNLQTLPLPEVEKKLGSSPEGLTQAEAQKRLTQYGPNAIAALKATLAIKARVKRDGKWVDPAARELVPGDAIRLRLGDIVPADARL